MPNQTYDFKTDPPLLIPTGYALSALTSGVGRATGRAPNQWASDPAQPMPQWVELAFDVPVRAGMACLTFDTDMNTPHHQGAGVTRCVKDYDVALHDGQGWTTVAKAKDNFQRFRVHRFAPRLLTRLRVTVHATHGDPSARIYGLRLYDE